MPKTPGDVINVSSGSNQLGWPSVRHVGLNVYQCAYDANRKKWLVYDGYNWYYIAESPETCFAREFGYAATRTVGTPVILPNPTCPRCNGSGKMPMFNGTGPCTCITP